MLKKTKTVEATGDLSSFSAFTHSLRGGGWVGGPWLGSNIGQNMRDVQTGGGGYLPYLSTFVFLQSLK